MDGTEVCTALPTAAAGIAGVVPSGGVTNAIVASGAAIADTKLATISTAGKVSDSALSSNVELLNAAQTVTGAKIFNAGKIILQNKAIAMSAGGNGAGSVTWTFPATEPDTNYGVVCMGTWASSFSVGTKSTTSVVVNYGTTTPNSSRTLDCMLFR